MITIRSLNTNPYINLATEEFLLKETKEEFMFFYVNDKSLIVGKHQNSNLEINVPLQHELQIPAIRRLSGGGTVYHDLGNLNFCFITNEENQRQVNFDKYALPLQKALKMMGIDITIGSRHEFLIADKKISGNASHIWKNRVIHHGTLLFESNLELLRNLLKIDRMKYIDKSVKSVSSSVISIKDAYKLNYTIETFTDQLIDHLSTIESAPIKSNFLETHQERIEKIATEKFNTWEWNYGYNPAYIFKKIIALSNGQSAEIELNVEKGKITDVLCLGNKEFLPILSSILIDQPHSYKEISQLLNENSEKLSGYIKTEELINSLF